MFPKCDVPLHGDRNQCPTCGELFTRTSVFDKHRTGRIGKNRRCMTVAEMEAAGMFKGADRFWRGKRADGFHWQAAEAIPGGE